jgi:hypothetical protein
MDNFVRHSCFLSDETVSNFIPYEQQTFQASCQLALKIVNKETLLL